MATSQFPGQEKLGEKEHRDELAEPFHNGEAVAWEPVEGDLWIPRRIRGSWRGGVLG